MDSRFLIRLTLLFITFFFIPKNVLSQGNKEHGERLEISTQFYDLLMGIVSDSNSIQILKLEKFVTEYPDFSLGAKWLFDRYVWANDLERAERFFIDLPESSYARINKNWMLGNVYSLQGKTDEALKAFTITLTTASPPPELILDFFWFFDRGHRKFEDRDFIAGLALDNESLDVMHALWYYINSKWQPAIERFNALSSQLQNNLTILYSWGNCLKRSDQSQLAKEKWQRGLDIARVHGNVHFESDFLLHLGIVAEDAETRRSYYDSSYAIAKPIGALTQLEYLAGNRAIIYRERGQFSLSDSLFLETINFSQQMRNKGAMSAWYTQYGSLLVRQDRFDEALNAFDAGANMAESVGRAGVLIRCQIRQGQIYRILGQYKLSRRALENVYQKIQNEDSPLLKRQVNIELADLALATERYAEARNVYHTYLENPAVTHDDLQDHAWWRIQAGRTYLGENNHKAARSEFRIARALADSAEYDFYTGFALLYLTEIDLIENDIENAHNHLDECTQLAEQTELGQVLPALNSLRGDAYKKDGELEKAVPQYKKAASLIEQTRHNLTSETSRLDYFGDKSDIYDKLVDCYREIYAATGNAAYLDSLYAYIEIKSSRTLRELRENGAQTPDADFDFRLDKLQQVQKRLKSQQRYLRDHRALFTKAELDSVSTQVQASRLSLIAQKLRLTQGGALDSDALLAKMPSLEKLSSILRVNESAAIFYHFSEHPFALVITGDTTAVVSLPTTISSLDASIRSLLNPFHQVAEDPEAVFKADLAYELYQSLVAPIEDVVELPANLLIAPDAHVANLPFELLLTKKPGQPQYSMTDPPTYANGFLIHQYSIGYVPNASFLEETDPGVASQNVVVFADPFDAAPVTSGQLLTSLRTGWIFDPLLYSSREAIGIKKVHSNTVIFRRERATKETLFQEAPKHDIIHFATHAFVDTTHDAFSGLVLSTSEDKGDDGILMGYEIAGMKLHADLVTLSACETGRGKIVPGEGVLGLPRLFLGAGANSVLMTHWKVEDKFAADFMIDFYGYYLKQGLPKARALAEAKRSVLNSPHKSGEINYHHPFFWASFAIYGEPGFQKPGRLVDFIITATTILLVLLLVGLIYRRRARGNVTIANVLRLPFL